MLTTNSSDPVVSLAGQVAHEIRQDAVAPLLNRAADQVSALASRGVNAVRDGSRQARATARRASDTSVTYVRAEPVKAVLMAVATGAALLAVFNLLTRSSARGSQKA